MWCISHHLFCVFTSFSLVHLEDAVEVSWGVKDKKKMSPNNQKGLSSMKQKLRKTRAQYEAAINDFRQRPVDTDQSEEERAAAADAPEEDEDEKEDEKAVEEVLTADDIDRKVAEIFEARGKRNANKKRQLEVLQNLLKVAEEPIAKAKVLLTTISVRLDSVTGLQAFMPTESWKLYFFFSLSYFFPTLFFTFSLSFFFFLLQDLRRVQPAPGNPREEF